MSSVTPASKTYNAFLSYSSRDKDLAALIQTSLEAFLRTPLRRRRLRIFRDQTSLDAGNRLWSGIRQNLDDSDAFIWLASPHSAVSEWAIEEFVYWVRNRGTRDVIVLLGGGDIVWDRNANTWNWEKTDAIPKEVAEDFSEAPRYLDYRDVRYIGEKEPLENSHVLDLTATIASRLLGRKKDDLIGQHLEDERKARLFRKRAVSAVAALCVFLMIAGVYAYRSKAAARIDKANRLAADGRGFQREHRLIEALSSVSQAYELQTTPRVHAAALLTEHPFLTLAARLKYSGPPPKHVAFSPDSKVLAIANQNGIVFWNIGAGDPRLMPFDSGVSRIRYVGPDMLLLASGPLPAAGAGKDLQGHVELYRVESNGDLKGGALFGYAGSVLGFSPSGRVALGYWRREGIILGCDVRNKGTVLSHSQVYGTTANWFGGARDRQTELEAPETLSPVAVAFDSFCGVENDVAIAAGIDDPRRVGDGSGPRLNVRGMALLNVLSPSGEVTWRSGHVGAVRTVTYSPDDSLLISGGDDGRICLWANHSLGTQPQRRIDNGSSVNVLDFHPGGHYFSSAGSDHSIRIWSREGDLIQVVRGPAEPVHHLQFSPDGQFLLSAGDGELLFWRVERSAPLAGGSAARPSGCGTFVEGGSKIAVTDSEGDIRLHRSPDLLPIGIVEMRSVADAARSITGDGSFSPGAVHSCVGAANSRSLFIGTSSGFIAELDTASTRVERIYQRKGSEVQSLALCPAARCLCAAQRDGRITIFDTARGVLSREIHLPEEPRFVELSRDCASALFSGKAWTLGAVNVNEARSERLVPVATNTAGAYPVYVLGRFDTQGRRAAVAAGNGVVEVFDVLRKRRIAMLDSGSPDRISALAFPSPSLLITGQSKVISRGGELELLAWDVDAKTIVDRFPLEKRLSSIVELNLDPQGKQLIVLARNVLDFDQGGESELKILGTPLLFHSEWRRDVLAPDPASAALWPALRASSCRAAAVIQDSPRDANDWYRGLNRSNAVRPLEQWIAGNSGHAYSFEAAMYRRELEKMIAARSPLH